MTKETYRDFLAWRGVDAPCRHCQGAGVRMYGSTATWRGGMGGQGFTRDVCSACWGSGDSDRPGADLRSLERAAAARAAVASFEWLASRTGANMRLLGPALLALADQIDAIGRKRKLPAGLDGIGGHAALRAVPAALRDMVEARRRLDP